MKLKFLLIIILILFSSYVFAFSTSSYDIEKVHQGLSGDKFTTSSYNARDTLTYQQATGEGSTSSYLFNSGWFDVTLSTSVTGNATINKVECNDNNSWKNCTQLNYNDYLAKIRVNCTVNQGVMGDVRFNLYNQQDNTSYIDASYNTIQGDYYILNSNYRLRDSGNWTLTVSCSAINNETNQTFFNFPFGWLNASLVDPVANTARQLYSYFYFRSKVECIGGECGNINATLDPIDIPIVNFEGTYDVNSREEKFDVSLIKENDEVEIKGVNENVEAKIDLGLEEYLTTSVVAIKTVPIENANFKLKKNGIVKSILMCEDQDFNYETMYCSEWQDSGINFADDGEYIEFTVDHLTAYAGGNISLGETGYLIVWDENDVGMPNASQNKLLNQQIRFFVDYKVSQNGTDINGSCNISFTDMNSTMQYDSNYNAFVMQRSFNVSSAYIYTVVCDHQNYRRTTASDVISVGNSTAKSGAVSTVIGDTPFYTTNLNPQICNNMYAGDICNNTWEVNATGILGSTHTFFVDYNGSYSSNSTNRINITISANDTTPPEILSTFTLPSVMYLSQIEKLYMTTSDNVQVNYCWVNITLPNTNWILLNDVCDSFKTYTPTMKGRHNVTFWVNDTSGNLRNALDYFDVVNSYNFTINPGNSSYTLDIILPSTGESMLRQTINGPTTLRIPDVLVDLLFKDFNDKLQVRLRNVNLSKDNNKKFQMDKTILKGYKVVYGINTSFSSYTNATVQIYYDDLNYNNENNLKLYKCDNWDYTNQKCNSGFNDITNNAIQNTSGNYFEYGTNTFSAFAIFESIVARSGGGGSEAKEMDIAIDGLCYGDQIEILITDYKELDNVRVMLYEERSSSGNLLGTYYSKNGIVNLNLEKGKYVLEFSKAGYGSEKRTIEITKCGCNNDYDCAETEYCENERCLLIPGLDYDFEEYKGKELKDVNWTKKEIKYEYPEEVKQGSVGSYFVFFIIILVLILFYGYLQQLKSGEKRVNIFDKIKYFWKKDDIKNKIRSLDKSIDSIDESFSKSVEKSFKKAKKKFKSSYGFLADKFKEIKKGKFVDDEDIPIKAITVRTKQDLKNLPEGLVVLNVARYKGDITKDLLRTKRKITKVGNHIYLK